MTSLPLAGIFDIESDGALFCSLCHTAEHLKRSKVKSTERLLYLLMGANHLRNWIAPGFNPKKDTPSTPAQHFSVAIWALPEFRAVNALCNHSKHLEGIDYTLAAEYGALVDDWPDWDAVRDTDRGPPISYRVNGRDLLEIIDAVLNFYRSQWYKT